MTPVPAAMDDVGKTDWADEVGEEVEQDSGYDENNCRTVTGYRFNDQGQRVRFTRTLRRQKQVVNKGVVARRRWKKFGDEVNKPPGPDPSTTRLAETVQLNLSANYKNHGIEDTEDKKTKEELKVGNILCRLCKGKHYTSRCPYKDTLSSTISDTPATTGATLAPSNKYIPPSLRNRTEVGTGMKDELPTIRVSNLSPSTREEDVRELFRNFGSLARVYLARERETNVCKGFAFVSFYQRENASNAIKKVNGFAYDKLILVVEWAKSSST